MKTIKTPDCGMHRVETDSERTAFLNGFKAALRCYGIFKDGTQVIGCMKTPIKNVIQEMERLNPA